jgi:hypothetical protein
MANNNILPNAIQAYRQRASDLFTQGAQLYDAEPDMTQMEEFARRRGAQSDSAMLNALAAQYAGEGFQPVQAQFLKKAAAAQDPMKLSGGILTPEGKFLKDPGVAQDKKAEFLLRQAQAYESLATNAQSAQEKRAAEQAQNAILNEIRMMNAQTARMQAGNANVGAFAPSGFTPQGQSIVTNSKNGMSYIVTVNPDGTPSYTPHQGASIPKSSYEKMTLEAGDLSGSAFNADRLIKQVEKSPEAFGLRGAAVGVLPGALQGYGAKAMKLTPEQMQTRANVLREAAMETNRLYGAALSMGEQARASSFIPDAKDPPEMVITKLQAARDWAQSKLGSMPQGVQNSAGARSPGGMGGSNDDPLGLRR